MIKAFIFDLDGTLTNSDKVHFIVFRDFFSKYGVGLTKELYREKVSGRQNESLLNDLLPKLSPDERLAFSVEKEETFRALAKGNIVPLPGLLKLLDKIEEQGLPIALVTNATSENTAFMLKELNVKNRFAPIVIGDELIRGKPDPLPYQTALNHLCVSAADVVAFEDSTVGIQSATRAGIKTIGLTTTHTSAELIEAGATRSLRDFTDSYVHTFF